MPHHLRYQSTPWATHHVVSRCIQGFAFSSPTKPIVCSEEACVANGELICTTNGFLSTCAVGAVADDDVTCNAIDDDCDGAIDEDYQPPQGENQITCGQGVCLSTALCQAIGINVRSLTR